MSVVSLLVVGQGRFACDEVIRHLGREQIAIVHEIDRGTGVDRSINESFDVVLIDDSQYDLDILRDLRKHSAVPIMVLTDKQEPNFRVQGFQLGADECLAKPVATEELVARILALLRRSAPFWRKKNDFIVCGHLRLSITTRRAYLRDRDLGLTIMESTILEQLMLAHGVLVSRDLLAIRLYGRESSPFERTIDTHISRIRRKLGDDRDLIISIRGNGYQLSVPVSENIQAS